MSFMSLVAFPASSGDPDPRPEDKEKSRPQGNSVQSPLSLADYLQMANLGRRAIRLVLTTVNGEHGLIDTTDGSIIHATYGSRRGLTAATRLMTTAISDIQVLDLPAAVPAVGGSLPKPIDQLLLDLAFEADRGSRGLGQPVARPDSPASEEGVDLPGLFRQAMAAYLVRDYELAIRLFEACEDARPGDQRVAANLRRLRRAHS